MGARLGTIDSDIASADSGFLFDRADFRAELEKLDLGPDPEDEAASAARRRTLAEWAQEEGLALSPPDQSYLEVDAPSNGRPLNRPAFVGLMCIGAGAAAAVFHEQVLRILAAL